jgi:hypothetical protein
MNNTILHNNKITILSYCIVKNIFMLSNLISMSVIHISTNIILNIKCKVNASIKINSKEHTI